MSTESSVVSLTGVSKIFGESGANRVVALRDIDLDVLSCEFVSVIGPSGCGKSTLLRLIGDLTPPTSGKVRVNNKTAHQARLDEDYGMVFQAPVLYEWRNVTKNVQLPLEVMGYKSKERKQRAKEMLDLVELGDFAHHYPWQLSGGMQQRVSIARALSFNPPILLMDEPFGALDEMTRERMNLELHDIWQQMEVTVIFVTHSILEAVFLSTRVVVMSARPGRIVTEIKVGLPIPRNADTREDPRFFELATEVREALRGSGGGLI